MANQYVRRLLFLVRFADRFLEGLSAALDRHRWFSLCLNFVLCVSAALSGWFHLPLSPFRAVFDLTLAALVFGCFVADLLFLLLGVDWLLVLAFCAAYVTAHPGSLASDSVYFLVAMLVGFSVCHSPLDAALYLLLVAVGYGLGHRREIRDSLKQLFSMRTPPRRILRSGPLPPGIARLRIHR